MRTGPGERVGVMRMVEVTRRAAEVKKILVDFVVDRVMLLLVSFGLRTGNFYTTRGGGI